MSETNNTQITDNTDTTDIANENNVPEAQELQQRQTYQVPAGDDNQNNSTPTFLSHIRASFWD